MISLLNSGWGEPLGIVKRLWESCGESVSACWVFMDGNKFMGCTGYILLECYTDQGLANRY